MIWWGKTLPRILAESRRLRVVWITDVDPAARPYRILVALVHCTTGELADSRDCYSVGVAGFEAATRAPDNG
jgi:hypothetical protein